MSLAGKDPVVVFLGGLAAGGLALWAANKYGLVGAACEFAQAHLPHRTDGGFLGALVPPETHSMQEAPSGVFPGYLVPDQLPSVNAKLFRTGPGKHRQDDVAAGDGIKLTPDNIIRRPLSIMSRNGKPGESTHDYRDQSRGQHSPAPEIPVSGISAEHQLATEVAQQAQLAGQKSTCGAGVPDFICNTTKAKRALPWMQ